MSEKNGVSNKLEKRVDEFAKNIENMLTQEVITIVKNVNETIENDKGEERLKYPDEIKTEILEELENLLDR